MEGGEVDQTLDEPLQEGRREIFCEHGRASRQLRFVGLEVHALECSEHGPKRDVVGSAEAAEKQGLRFGVSEHLWISYKCGRGAWVGQDGALAGVSYDGIDPQNFDLYHDAESARFGDKLDWNDDGFRTRGSSIMWTALRI